VSNTAAGCIIGKGGSTINDFQSQSGARIQLSRSHEFFPGTNDRIIMVSGHFDDVTKAMELVLEKLLAEVNSICVAVNSRFRRTVWHCLMIDVLLQSSRGKNLMKLKLGLSLDL
jgi:hypothetical protein